MAAQARTTSESPAPRRNRIRRILELGRPGLRARDRPPSCRSLPACRMPLNATLPFVDLPRSSPATMVTCLDRRRDGETSRDRCAGGDRGHFLLVQCSTWARRVKYSSGRSESASWAAPRRLSSVSKLRETRASARLDRAGPRAWPGSRGSRDLGVGLLHASAWRRAGLTCKTKGRRAGRNSNSVRAP